MTQWAAQMDLMGILMDASSGAEFGGWKGVGKYEDPIPNHQMAQLRLKIVINEAHYSASKSDRPI